MELVSIALICVFIIQVVCYWANYRIIQRLTIAIGLVDMPQIITNGAYSLIMLFISISSLFMFLSMRYIHLIFITCGLMLIVLVTVANFISERGENHNVG